MTQARGPFRRVLRLASTNPRRWRRAWQSMHPASIAARAVECARRDLGYSEHPAGSNMTKFGVYWNQNGVPWCGMAVAYWWQRAGFNVSSELALQIDYVPRLLELARERKFNMFVIGRNRVRAGDAVAFDFPGGERADHVGLFVRWIDKRAGDFQAIEGNTSSTGSQSNGGMVLLKVRNVEQVAGFVRKVR
jgi:hypothetical protein